MTEKEIPFVNSMMSENTEFADVLIASLNQEELMDLCLDLSDEYGLLLISYLSDQFSLTRNLNLLNVIIALLATKFSYWEGKDFFEIKLFKKASVFFPDSVSVLESLLVYSLAPYQKDVFTGFIDFRAVSPKLHELSPESLVLKTFMLTNS